MIAKLILSDLQAIDITTKSCLVEIVNSILYKLKTGVQWALLPIKSLFSKVVLNAKSVYAHYNKWSKQGIWQKCWSSILSKFGSSLDLSSVDLDGRHTPALCGG